MNYLIYIERSAENLQFFLWYRDYVKRFKAADTADIKLAPEWTQAMEEDAVTRLQKEHADKMRKQPPGAEIFKGTDFEKRPAPTVFETKDPFSTPPRTPGDQDSQFSGSHALSYRSQANEAFSSAGAKVPCEYPKIQKKRRLANLSSVVTIQPFRAEIDRVIATYLMDGAPRQLNLSSREQKATFQALAYTTHPSAFRIVARSIESTLRQQAHPNFIRWSICNGNPARVFFARGLGVSLIAISFAVAIVLTLSRARRGYAALAAVGWVLGISTLVAAWKGMCVVLHGMHHRHVRPWELFVDDEEQLDRISSEGGKSIKDSFDSFGTANSYEDEPWVVKYKKRNIVRKIFDREVWIQEPALRQIQDTIFVQSMLCALLAAGALTAIFVAVPRGHFF